MDIFDGFGYSRFVDGLDSIAMLPNDPGLADIRGTLSATS